MATNSKKIFEKNLPSLVAPSASLAFTRWLATQTSEDTVRTYLRALRQAMPILSEIASKYGAHTLEDLPRALARFTAADAMEFRRKYQNTPVVLGGGQDPARRAARAAQSTRLPSAATCAQVEAALSSFWKWAIQIGEFSGPNPWREIGRPKPARNLAGKILTREEVRQLIAAAGRWSLFVRTMYYLGARSIEMRRLQLRDLSVQGGSGIVHLFGKGDKDRYISVPLAVIDDLRAAAGTDDPQAYVFRVPYTSRPLSRKQVWQIVRQAAQAAGLERPVTQVYWRDGRLEKIARPARRITPHMLRHSRATHLAEERVGREMIKDFLGHSNYETTDIYVHLANQEPLPNTLDDDWR